MKRLIIKRNLLPWYNEIYNTLDLNAPGFPQTVLNKIKTFGNSAIETIDKKKNYVRSCEKKDLTCRERQCLRS